MLIPHSGEHACGTAGRILQATPLTNHRSQRAVVVVAGSKSDDRDVVLPFAGVEEEGDEYPWDCGRGQPLFVLIGMRRRHSDPGRRACLSTSCQFL